MKNNNLGRKYKFTAIVTHEIFYDVDSMWGVYAFKTKEDIPEAPMIADDYFESTKGSWYNSSLTGKTQRLNVGMEYKVTGKLSYSEKYKSHSYEILSAQADVPKTHEQQRKFLESILTERQAETISSVYPNAVADILSGKDDYIDLGKLNGIGAFIWDKVTTKIIENYVMADILVMLVPLGVSIAKIKSLFEHEKNPSVIKKLLLENPYIISRIEGISFKQADKIAISLNPELIKSEERLCSFLEYYIFKAGQEHGHTWISFSEMKGAVRENAIECFDLLKDVVERERETPNLFHVEGKRIGLSLYRFVEEEILRMIDDISNSELIEISQEEIDTGIKISEEEQGFSFTEEQKELLVEMTKSNFNMITGKAGSGKSTLLRGIVNIYRNSQIGSCALSAKAAKRIEETTGRGASTIHRLLLSRGGNNFEYGYDNKMPYGVVVVDESSMINANIMYYLLSAIKNGSKLILCGDSKQLPPIGYGNVFSDLLTMEHLQVNNLTKIMRQAEESGIIFDANKIREGINPIGDFKPRIINGKLRDMVYMFKDEEYQLRKTAIKTFLSSVESQGLDNTYILVPRKNNCTNSSLNINKIIQKELVGDQPFVEFMKRKYHLGCKVIHRKNNYEKNIFNGEMGYIVDIKDGGLVVDYGNEKLISYYGNEIKQMDYAYALTTHLYQGSEAHTIIGIIDMSHYTLLDTTFLYTMITRAKVRCLLLAHPSAFNKCLKNNKSKNRQTWMKEIENV